MKVEITREFHYNPQKVDEGYWLLRQFITENYLEQLKKEQS